MEKNPENLENFVIFNWMFSSAAQPIDWPSYNVNAQEETKHSPESYNLKM